MWATQNEAKFLSEFKLSRQGAGLLWLSTVPPTSGLVTVMFGTLWLATLFGFAFFSHQIGGFLGVWLGGILFERAGSYDAVWWLAILLGLLSAAINLPIVEKPLVAQNAKLFRNQLLAVRDSFRSKS